MHIEYIQNENGTIAVVSSNGEKADRKSVV